MEFVESQPKGKLPIHPSYLELKRLLVEHEQFRSSDAEVVAAKARLKATAAVAEAAPNDTSDPSKPSA